MITSLRILALTLAPVLGLHPAGAQTRAPADCVSAQAAKAPHLYGLWTASFTHPPRGLPAQATMLLERHAEFSESLAGVVSRDLSGAPDGAVAGHAGKAFLAGDIEDGILTLDESSNAINITATWNGEIVKDSCANKITGVWKDTSSAAPSDAPEIAFTLTKRAGW
ncbi:MAG: hypothetical protein V4731_12605 [Pseudomonadota bacterium]